MTRLIISDVIIKSDIVLELFAQEEITREKEMFQKYLM